MSCVFNTSLGCLGKIAECFSRPIVMSRKMYALAVSYRQRVEPDKLGEFLLLATLLSRLHLASVGGKGLLVPRPPCLVWLDAVR